MRRLAGTALGLWAILAAAGPARAIVINDTSAPGYVTGNGQFTGVAKLTFNYLAQGSATFLCSGALMIDGIHVVTAGHCVSGAANWQVTFETPGGMTTLGTSAAAVHPLFASRPAPLDQINQYDVAILTLAGLAPADAARYGILDDLPGPSTTVDLVGYGLGGSPDGNLGAGVRRHATNTIDGAVSTFVDGPASVPSPDLPLIMSVVFGDGTSAGEGLVSGGDSGGPALLGTDIVGLGTTTNVPRSPDLMQDGVFYFSSHANLTNDAIGDWLLSFVQVREPAATLPFAAGALLLLAVAGRRGAAVSARPPPPRSRS
jgi:hypothetical protein